MKVGIVANLKKIKDETIIVRLQALLSNAGYDCVRFHSNEEIENVDVIIVLGGDGAILHSAVVAAQKGIKVIGINYGNLGFLAEYERTETENVLELLEKLKNGNCHVLKRSVLEICLGDTKYYALNEVSLQRDFAIHTANSEQILRIHTEIGKEGSDVAGDGLLLCTPTGSTAYSLSAGGAILFPDVPVFMMTQICALALHSRPVVFSDSEEFKAEIMRGMALVIVDGKVVDVLRENESLTVKKASFTADFPMNEKTVFLQKIKNKLNK